MDNSDSIKKLLLEREQKLLESEIRRNAAELHKLLAPTFFEIGSSGKMMYRGESTEQIQLSTVHMQLSDFKIHPLSKEIVLTTYRIYDVLNDQSSLRSSIWKLIDDEWKMHFHQGTKVPSST